MLPTLTEAKDPNWFAVGPSQIRLGGDVEIPYGAGVDNIRYYVASPDASTPEWMTSDDIAGNFDDDTKALLDNGGNCKTLFQPGNIYYRNYKAAGTVFSPYLESNEFRYVDIQPFDDASQSPLIRIRECCDPSACVEKCFTGQGVRKASFYIVNPDKETVFMRGVCSFCAITSCITQCSAGEYATAASRFDTVITTPPPGF